MTENANDQNDGADSGEYSEPEMYQPIRGGHKSANAKLVAQAASGSDKRTNQVQARLT